jgi:hypothetical protein
MDPRSVSNSIRGLIPLVLHTPHLYIAKCLRRSGRKAEERYSVAVAQSRTWSLVYRVRRPRSEEAKSCSIDFAALHGQRSMCLDLPIVSRYGCVMSSSLTSIPFFTRLLRGQYWT